MAKTALQMVQSAEIELGLAPSTTAYGPTADVTGAQMGQLANRVLDEMRRMTRWSAMQAEYIIIVNPPLITTGDMAAQSKIVTNIPSTAGIIAQAWMMAGPGVPVAARVASVDSPTQVTLTMENTNTQLVTGATLTFSQDTYPMPTDFDWMNNRTMWDRTNRWELLGPDSPQMDQWHRSGIVVTGPRRHFRQIGPLLNQFRIWPQPAEITAPLQLVFEYMSDAAVGVHGSFTNFFKYFVNDDDKPVLDDNAIIQGIKWLFWEAKGFGSYVTQQQRWVDYVERLIARDGAAPTLNLVKRVHPIFISPANVQDGFFPGPVGPNQA